MATGLAQSFGCFGSPGLGVRYCVVEFPFHRGVGRTRSREDKWGEFLVEYGSRFPAETLRRREVVWINKKSCAQLQVAV